MVNAEQVLSVYERMAELSGQMLRAAQARDWETLARLEQHCASHVRTLEAGEGQLATSGASRERKISLIQKILADDRAIRDLTTPWMAELAALIANTGTQRKLNRAYGAA
jgi:flagellar protein FliT